MLKSVRQRVPSKRDILTYCAMIAVGIGGIACDSTKPRINDPGLVGIVTLDLDKYAQTAIDKKDPNRLASIIRSYIAVGDTEKAKEYLHPLFDLNPFIGLNVAKDIQDYLDENR